MEVDGLSKGGDAPIERILAPFQRFLHHQTTGGVLLMCVTVIALIWANSPFADSYDHLWHTKLKVELGAFSISESLHWWINDALMAAFFFVVGLEIKREMMVGELSSRQKAALPIAAAVGGMVVPALIYAVLNFGGDGQSGWGVPMATDIAFAIGVLSLVGDRIPTSAKVFLTAFAIVDDIGAALVIAVFYTDQISWMNLAVAGVFFLLMLGANRLGVRSALTFFLLGLGLWFGFLKSGIHPTLSGIIGALAIPSRVRIDAAQFLVRSSHCMKRFETAGKTGSNVLTNSEQRGALQSLEDAVNQAQTPLQQLEHGMHPWVSFVIMPLFALANAGVVLSGNVGVAMTSSVLLGVVGGLVIGKPLGIMLFSYMAVRGGVATLPNGVTWKMIFGVACLGGIGFTMSLFIAGLAFGDSPQLQYAKLAILGASVVSAVVGWLMLSRMR